MREQNGKQAFVFEAQVHHLTYEVRHFNLYSVGTIYTAVFRSSVYLGAKSYGYIYSTTPIIYLIWASGSPCRCLLMPYNHCASEDSARIRKLVCYASKQNQEPHDSRTAHQNLMTRRPIVPRGFGLDLILRQPRPLPYDLA